MKRNILFIIIILLSTSGLPVHATWLQHSRLEDNIKIMPVGNSITSGEYYGSQALGEITGYRKTLYELLMNAGYNVDFIGSQNHGIRSKENKDWYDWNCEAYPGWKIAGIANKLDTALIVYQPDILPLRVVI